MNTRASKEYRKSTEGFVIAKASNSNISLDSNKSNISNTRKRISKMNLNDLNIIPIDGNPNKLHKFLGVAGALLVYYFDNENINNF